MLSIAPCIQYVFVFHSYVLFVFINSMTAGWLLIVCVCMCVFCIPINSGLNSRTRIESCDFIVLISDP